MGKGIRCFFGGATQGSDTRRLLSCLEGGEGIVVLPVQRHTATVLWIADGKRPETPADALVTDRPGLALGIRTADCVPVLVADARRGIVAAVHAGWRGTASGILEKTLEMMGHRAGSDPGDIRVAIGPAIGPCCYEVGPEVTEALGLGGGGLQRHVDLSDANARQAVQWGIRAEHIWRSPACTRCSAGILHSYRRDGQNSGRQVSLIMRNG